MAIKTENESTVILTEIKNFLLKNSSIEKEQLFHWLVNCDFWHFNPFIKEENLGININSNFLDKFKKNKEDNYSANRLRKEFKINNFFVSSSSANGDCLFNSFSLLLQGDEKRSHDLRWVLIKQFVEEYKKYENNINSIAPFYTPYSIIFSLSNYNSTYGWGDFLDINLMADYINVPIYVIKFYNNYKFFLWKKEKPTYIFSFGENYENSKIGIFWIIYVNDNHFLPVFFGNKQEEERLIMYHKKKENLKAKEIFYEEYDSLIFFIPIISFFSFFVIKKIIVELKLNF